MIDISIREWCEEVYNNLREGSWDEADNITIDVARADLDHFRHDGWGLPSGITPELYAEAMNDIADEESENNV